MVADLGRQEAAIREQRERLVGLLGRQRDLADPEQVAAYAALARRFDALSGVDPADPQVEQVAASMVTLAREGGQPGLAESTSCPAARGDAWAAYQVTLAPAQQHCLTLVEEAYAACER